MVKFSWDDTKTSWRLVCLAQMEGPGFGHGAVQLLTPQTWSFWRSNVRHGKWPIEIDGLPLFNGDLTTI